MELLNVKGTEMNIKNSSVEINNSFYEKYDPKIRAVVARILNQANRMQDIDDCVNTVYLQLIDKLQQYNETRGSMEAFVSVVSRSAALNYCKSSQRKTSELIGDDKLDFLAEPLEYEDEVEFNMLVEDILERLNKKERILFTMRYLYFYSPEQIAKAMQINRSAVDMRVNRLKKKIKNFLTKGGIMI
jgi:RNA polymerase sigma-70 factor (ECF subfamily)